jgi:L-asparaginase
MRWRRLPPAADPYNPTPDELAAIKAKLDQYEAIFESH